MDAPVLGQNGKVLKRNKKPAEKNPAKRKKSAKVMVKTGWPLTMVLKRSRWLMSL
jgi:hypothetical protein